MLYRLWPLAHRGREAMHIESIALIQLHNGLESGAMGDTLVEEPLYRAFITLFSTNFAKNPTDDPTERDRITNDAYDQTLYVCGKPIPHQQSVTFDDPSGAVMRLLQNDLN